MTREQQQPKEQDGYHIIEYVSENGDRLNLKQPIRSRPTPAPVLTEHDMTYAYEHGLRDGAAKEREKVQPFIDLARVLATKCDEMQDLMRRNKIVIDNVQEPMQKLAFTFYSEIAELAHKAEVVIEEYEESLRHPKNSSEFEGVGAKPNEGAK